VAPFSIGWTAVAPSPVIAGRLATVAARVQARREGIATIDAVVRDAQGRLIWQMAWRDQAFARRQSRDYVANWPAPATLPSGSYGLTVRVRGSGGEDLALSATGAAGEPVAGPTIERGGAGLNDRVRGSSCGPGDALARSRPDGVAGVEVPRPRRLRPNRVGSPDC
jgi:hypothetical protein